ncbi:Vacuolar transporter chaperone 4 [Golovinomyces cichoracearum]|uniref:Vacuolar transporter chaperone complex subunit 4 n=1 Tax=Golovinomyces cichoracearum TaxID=62708 RepID=A0A420IQ31_9PEZI|nr:Vacuolar transporter chaperone 4 [Golovinomyces cichoracearum]
MKFGYQLRTSIIKEYQWNYIAYDELKSQLEATNKKKSPQKESEKNCIPWTEEDETKFLARLESELDKVHTKQKIKAIEISRRIAASEIEVKEIASRLEANLDAPIEEEFMMLEEDLSDIIADVHDLAKFVQLNYTGFQKIIKKHDKQTKWVLKPVFATMLKARNFFKDNYEADIVKLSKLYDVVRTRGNPVKGDSAAGGSQGNFIRQTTKYWVHPDNITEVKLIILKHLPVLVFNAKKEFESKDSAITSIYYDNPQTFELYRGRLKKTEGAEAIRMRWYGGMDTETIFVERKTHREDWTGEKSVKARFSLKEKNMNAYLRGDLLPNQIFEKVRKEGKKSLNQIEEDERLSKEIQYSILNNGYKPVCRSFYNRTAFQLPADARVRISLDTELTMIREDSLDGRKRAGENWRRLDIGIDYPFPNLPSEDIERFPYAVLEVKLQTQAGQEPPEWVRELTASHLVEAVPKFSKFIHGTATLFPTRINLLPYWMPQMNIDIRKPAIQRFGIHRPGQSIPSSTSDDDSDDNYDFTNAGDLISSPDRPTNRNRDRPEVHNSASTNTPDLEEVGGNYSLEDNDYPIYDSENEESETVDTGETQHGSGFSNYLKKGQAYTSLAKQKLVNGITALWRTIPYSCNLKPPSQQNGLTVNARYKAPKGKKIYVPIRIEPKVYLASERTYLSWLEYCVYLGYISVTLLNFGSKNHFIDFLPALAFITVALISNIYALIMYGYRSHAIRHRRIIRYHDRYGPTFHCFVLLFAIGLNFWNEIGVRNKVLSPWGKISGS